MGVLSLGSFDILQIKLQHGMEEGLWEFSGAPNVV